MHAIRSNLLPGPLPLVSSLDQRHRADELAPLDTYSAEIVEDFLKTMSGYMCAAVVPTDHEFTRSIPPLLAGLISFTMTALESKASGSRCLYLDFANVLLAEVLAVISWQVSGQEQSSFHVFLFASNSASQRRQHPSNSSGRKACLNKSHPQISQQLSSSPLKPPLHSPQQILP